VHGDRFPILATANQPTAGAVDEYDVDQTAANGTH